VQVPAEVLECDQVGQVPLAGRVYLAPVFAEFRRDHRQVEGLVHRPFGLAGYPLSLATGGLGIGVVGSRQVADVERAVLVEAHVALEGVGPQADVVFLAPREILDRGTELVGVDDPEVDAAPAGPDCGLGRAGLDDGLDAVGVGKGRDGGLGVARGDEDVDVPDGGLPATQRSGDLAAFDRVESAQPVEEVVGDRSRGAQQLSALGLPGERDVLEDVLLGLRSEPLHLADRPCIGGPLEVLQRLDAQRLVERPDGLGADALDAGQSRHVDRQLLAQLFEFGYLAGFGELGYLLGDGLADALDRLEFLGVVRGHPVGLGANVLGGPSVGPGLVLDVPGRQQVGHRLQFCRDLVVRSHSFGRGSSREPFVPSVRRPSSVSIAPAISVPGPRRRPGPAPARGT